ncbi:MAG: hypothetical protein LBN38_00815 [Verrucomicrobiota bacterium]|nr:hypothetical protein [Verrucomicrobiota bacterium]
MREHYELKIRPCHYTAATEYGLTESPRSPRLVVSLTSHPQRISTIHHTVNSLLRQSLKPDALVLWLAEDQFPGREKDLPEEALRLRQWGLSIRWCRDLRSYKKLVPALRAFPEDILVTADDDVFYPRHWLKSLYEAHLETPRLIRAGLTHRVTLDAQEAVRPFTEWEWHAYHHPPSLLNSFLGCHGVLYPPHSLHEDIFREDLFMEVAPTVDDLWFWAMAVLQETRIWAVQRNRQQILTFPAGRVSALWYANWSGGGNEIQLKRILDYYPRLRELVRAEGRLSVASGRQGAGSAAELHCDLPSNGL